jgi:ribose 5-phosphate isomerase B
MSITKPKKIFIANDHGGFELKRHLMFRFPELPWVDLGTNSDASVDYPDFAAAVAESMKEAPSGSRGILICGSGQGMAMKANRYPHVRAALCWNEQVAKLAREHNDANVLCLAGRLTAFTVADRILEVFLKTPFEGGRHIKRVNKLGC